MLGGAADGLIQLDGPSCGRLPWARINEIERRAAENRGRGLDRLHRFLDRMHPAERPEVGVIQRLHAERDAVDPRRPVAAQPASLDAGGVGFERHFNVGRHAPVRGNGVEDRPDCLGLHQRWRAAAQENARHGTARGHTGLMSDLARESRRVARLIHFGEADMAVEIAIGTFRRAEGPVHIDPKPRVEGQMGVHRACLSVRPTFGKPNDGARRTGRAANPHPTQ